MSNFVIFKAAFNDSATPAIGAYTAEGGTALFNRNTSISPDYYLYNTAHYTAVQWFVPTAETTDFEFVADILTREWDNRVTYFIIADSTGTTRLRMWSVRTNWYFENSDSTATTGSPEYIGGINPDTSGGFGVFHQFRVRVRKLTASSSGVEVYVDGTLKLTATAGAALVTCAKIGFVGGVGTFGPGTDAGIKNAYVYDLSGGDVIDRGVLSGAFNRFISWMKSKFALKSDIPTVNDATLTIQQNGVNVQTFTANQSTNATANIQCVDLTSNQTVGGNKEFTGTTTAHDLVPSATDTYNFGSSSVQWNNAYIKSLTINGVVCGDILTHNVSEFVDVSSNQTIGGVKTFSDGVVGNVSSTGALTLQTKSGTAKIYLRDSKASNFPNTVNLYSTVDGQQYGVFLNGKSFHPVSDNMDLGNSLRKWKTFNGINPGALSLPGTSVNVDTTNWVLDGSNVNIFTPASDGWLGIQVTDTVYDQMHYIFIGRTGDDSTYYQQNVLSPISALWDGEYHGCVFIPVVKNSNYGIRCICSTIVATFYPCQGNV